MTFGKNLAVVRLVSCFLIIVGVYALIATGYDQHRGVTSIGALVSYATIANPITIVRKDDPVGFRNVVVSGYVFGLISIGIGLRMVWSARRITDRTEGHPSAN